MYWAIQNDCGQVWQLCTKIYVATVWVGDISLTVQRRAILKVVKSMCNGIKQIKCALMKCHTNY
jgi:hypothetical protein